jgi:DNA-binding PadR family transcriptional regulator
MALRYGLLDLLAGEPMSGYDLARYFSLSMANVWPAQHSQIYPELARLFDEGLIAQVGEGPRGRKIYQTTPAGLEALRSWLRDTPPDYSVRSEALLRIFGLWALPTDEALALLARDRAEYVRHLADIDKVLAEKDWGETRVTRASRMTIEFGHRFYAMQVAWCDWAAEQVAAGTLQTGGPLPGDAAVIGPPAGGPRRSPGTRRGSPPVAASRRQ